jgi:hypothetical protein
VIVWQRCRVVTFMRPRRPIRVADVAAMAERLRNRFKREARAREQRLGAEPE